MFVTSRSRWWLWGLAGLLVVNSVYLASAAAPVGSWYLANVLLHLILGLGLMAPLTIWMWRRRGSRAGIGWALLLLSALAGLALVVLGNRSALRPLVWAHLGLAIVGFTVLLTTVHRRWRAAFAGLVAVALVASLARLRAGEPATRPAPFSNPKAPLTMSEQAMGGEKGPFYPAALSTRGGGRLPETVFARPESCGRAGCHPDIVAEWSASAHRFSGLDSPWYRRSFEEVRQVVGELPARWCAGCHTPALLVTGGLDASAGRMATSATAKAGVSCMVCHAVSRVESSMGQGDYEIDVSALHRLANSPRPVTRWLHDLLLRADPEPHRRAYRRPVLASAEFCAACHKAHVDVPVNRYRHLGVMNDYDPWQSTSASGQGMTQSIYFPEPKSCSDCHMPAVPSADAGGEGGKVRSHRFAAANTAGPFLRGDQRQLQAVTDFLKAGKITMEIFAMSKGRPQSEGGSESPQQRAENLYAPLDRIPATLRRGESTRFDVVLRSRGIGHMFPGGKYVLKDAWVEFQAVDDRGRVLFWSGREDASGRVESGAHFVSNLWIDGEGRKSERYDVWATRAAVFAQRIEPHTAFVVRFRLDVRPDAGDRITLVSRLKQRTFRPRFTEWVFAGSGRVPRLPVVTMAETAMTLPVVDAGAELPDMTRPTMDPKVDAERWNDYAFGLANRADFILSRKAFKVVLALKPDYADGWTTLGNLEWAIGNMPEARVLLQRALGVDPHLARAHYYLGLVDQAEGHYDPALEHLRAAAQRYPRDPRVWGEIGHTLLLKAQYREAAEAFDKALAINPETASIHFMLTLVHRALGNQQLSQRHHALFNRFRDDPLSQRLVGAYLKTDPDANFERQPLHEHRSVPLDGIHP